MFDEITERDGYSVSACGRAETEMRGEVIPRESSINVSGEEEEEDE